MDQNTRDYLEMMAGRKPLELEYKNGEFVSGYTASGVSAKIIEYLHCGQYVDGWGFLVDREFEDGDIERMKRHFEEWQKMMRIREEEEAAERAAYEAEKEALLFGVQWEWEERYEMEGTKSYIHRIDIEGTYYQFREKYISGMGKVILPEYEIIPGAEAEPILEEIRGQLCWNFFFQGRERHIPLDEFELRAYTIVKKYGQLK